MKRNTSGSFSLRICVGTDKNNDYKKTGVFDSFTGFFELIT